MVSTKPKLQLSEQHLYSTYIPQQVFRMYDLKVTYNHKKDNGVSKSAKWKTGKSRGKGIVNRLKSSSQLCVF